MPCNYGQEKTLSTRNRTQAALVGGQQATNLPPEHLCVYDTLLYVISDVVGKNNNLFPLSRMNTCTKITCTSLKVRFGLQLLEEKEKSFRGGPPQKKT